MPTIDFWYEFASTYSYLSAMRIEGEAQKVGVVVRWRPFLLGPVFASQGWQTSPFNLYPDKGRYMWRDLERHAEALGEKLGRPDPFPQNGLLAARVALVAHDEGWGEAFANSVYAAEFGELLQISDSEVIGGIILELGHDPRAVLSRAQSDDNKARLRKQTEQAIGLGIFGAPSFVAEDGELFWGNDRLGEALHWARHASLKGLIGPVEKRVAARRPAR